MLPVSFSGIPVRTQNFLNRFLLDVKSAHRRKPGQDAAHFKTDENSGKMVIDDSDSDNGNEATAGAEEDVVGNAYKESLTSVDGFTRGQGGRIKFNKDTKKRRKEDIDIDDDIEMADGENINTKRKNKKTNEGPRLGHEFKAKVRESVGFLSYGMCLKNFPCRKLGATSRSMAWTPTLTLLCLKLLSDEKVTNGLGLLRSGNEITK